MKHNRHRLSRWMTARSIALRAVTAWRDLLPDWTPELGELLALDARPVEHRFAVKTITQGWSLEDPRWDVLLALLEWERRAERTKSHAIDKVDQDCRYCGADHSDGSDCNTYSNVVSMDQEYERLRHDSEVTTETFIPDEIREGYKRLTAVVYDTKPLERSNKPVRMVPNPERGPNWFIVPKGDE